MLHAEVRVQALARLFGRVTNERGEAVQATVAAFRLGSRQVAAQTKTDFFEGAWQLRGLESGPTRLVIRSAGYPTQRMDLEVVLGKGQPIEIVLPEPRIAGDITGALVGPVEGRPPIGMILLESAEGTSPQRALEWLDEDQAVDARTPFVFSSLPEGTYALSCVSLDGRTFAPARFTVSPPATVEFTTQESAGEADSWRCCLRFRDARTGEDLSDRASFRRNYVGFWTDEVDSASFLDWLESEGATAHMSLAISVEGYRPTRLDLDSLRTAHYSSAPYRHFIDLQPGNGAAIVVLDGDSAMMDTSSWTRTERGLQGARVRSNGRLVGVTDELGLALCQSDQPIGEIEVDLPGWIAVSGAGSFDLDSEGGHAVVVMVRE